MKTGHMDLGINSVYISFDKSGI